MSSEAVAFIASNGIRVVQNESGVTIRDPRAGAWEARILTIQSRKALALREFFTSADGADE